jgi:hypothetical protein
MRSGQIRPGFSNKVNAEVINPFIKIGGAEFLELQTITGGVHGAEAADAAPERV